MLAFFTDGLEIGDDEGHQVGAHLHRRVKLILEQPVGHFYVLSYWKKQPCISLHLHDTVCKEIYWENTVWSYWITLQIV